MKTVKAEKSLENSTILARRDLDTRATLSAFIHLYLLHYN